MAKTFIEELREGVALANRKELARRNQRRLIELLLRKFEIVPADVHESIAQIDDPKVLEDLLVTFKPINPWAEVRAVLSTLCAKPKRRRSKKTKAARS